ncbi:dTDP-4-amino-4,6-dideoxygalactose transaminase [Mycobacterium frederiksbergense]|uniref:dTDP-4-amino-4,6-dideoxygalactose transaminase n=1 Tax=Mycolicibacterium frederiksbergense TaxID=117567 RepID=A0ABT6KZW7_9MYCO|nr:DegT/DnrJ/EryC1/StrS family aminotransferase [Mycolicibacterium frederiksbergense]MDH6196236.1 dTDP-4-amino-4,6-dideoxygalactose transaminase [Mycolicibacterium frederiksbergense]
MSIPLVDLAAQHREIADEIAPQLQQVLETGAFIGGSAVTEFEREYADFVGVDHVVGVGNGTDALELVLRGIDVGPGDEVIIPANTFIATAEAVSRIGAVPVLVDVDPDYLLIDPLCVEKAISTRTKAIVPVHLFGQVAPIENLVDLADAYGLSVVEDAAQSQGATRLGRHAGSFGAAAGTSFYPGKNLGAAGDAGAVLTNDPEIATRVRTIAAHGSDRKYVHDVVGFNSRLDTVQAVVLRAKLRRLSSWNVLRQNAAAHYRELLDDVPGVRLPTTDPANVDVWHLFVVQVDERDRVLADMNAAGVAAGVHYPAPIHLTGAYRSLGYRAGDYPVAEAAAGRILSLPLYPHITTDQQRQVVASLLAAITPQC